MGKQEVKQERSIAVYGRVDAVSLAEVLSGLLKNDYRPRTLSGLISYCVEIAHSAMKQNDLLGKRFEGIGAAFYFLHDLGYMTRSMFEKNIKKANMAWSFENLRNEGDDPEFAAPGIYKMLHNQRSVEAPVVDSRNVVISDEKTKEMLEEYNRRAMAALEPKEYSGERVKKDNTPIDPRSEEAIEWNKKMAQAEKDKLSCECDSGVTSEPPSTEPPKKRGRPRKVDESVPRHLTDDELEDKAEEIARRDREIASMDMSAPKS